MTAGTSALKLVVTDIDEENDEVVLDLTIKNAQEETRVFGTATVRFPPAG